MGSWGMPRLTLLLFRNILVSVSQHNAPPLVCEHWAKQINKIVFVTCAEYNRCRTYREMLTYKPLTNNGAKTIFDVGDFYSETFRSSVTRKYLFNVADEPLVSSDATSDERAQQSRLNLARINLWFNVISYLGFAHICEYIVWMSLIYLLLFACRK